MAEEVRWACAMDRNARVLFSHPVDNDPAAIGALNIEIEALEARATRTAVDMLDGAASLICAMLAEAGLLPVHTPDPLDAEVRLLVRRCRELVTEQTRRAACLRDLLSGLFPALERRIDPRTRTSLMFLSHHAAPEDIRAAGVKRIVRKLTKAETNLRGLEPMAEDADQAARVQTVTITGARLKAEINAAIALEALAARDRLTATAQAIRDRLATYPDAALILSMPGMGATLTAEFIAFVGRIGRFDSADALATAAGLAPVLRQSGKTGLLRQATGGDKVLKRVFYQATFTPLGHTDSRTFYDRKRVEGERHHQAVIALARRRVNVPWAILRNREPFRENFKLAA